MSNENEQKQRCVFEALDEMQLRYDFLLVEFLPFWHTGCCLPMPGVSGGAGAGRGGSDWASRATQPQADSTQRCSSFSRLCSRLSCACVGSPHKDMHVRTSGNSTLSTAVPSVRTQRIAKRILKLETLRQSNYVRPFVFRIAFHCQSEEIQMHFNNEQGETLY